jgi:hypothetical protein
MKKSVFSVLGLFYRKLDAYNLSQVTTLWLYSAGVEVHGVNPLAVIGLKQWKAKEKKQIAIFNSFKFTSS